VQLDQVLDQRQAQSQPARSTVGAAFGLGEQVEGARDQFGRHADAVVHHLDADGVFVGLDVEAQGAAFLGVLGGVVEDIGQHLHQALLVAAHQCRRRRQPHAQLLAARLYQRRHLLDSVGGDLADVQHHLVQLDQAARDPRDVEQVVDQRGHVAHLAPDDLAGRAHHRFVGVACCSRSAAAPIGASGLRSSCASMARNSSLRRSSSFSFSSAILRSVMSLAAPIHSSISPSSPEHRHGARQGPAHAAVHAAYAVLEFEDALVADRLGDGGVHQLLVLERNIVVEPDGARAGGILRRSRGHRAGATRSNRRSCGR
jgi:hypothetical protein